MPDQNFFLVDYQVSWDWSASATDVNFIDAICGLGYEKVSEQSSGWLARGVYEHSDFGW